MDGAQVAKEWLDQMQDPELSIQQAMLDYKRLGYFDNWDKSVTQKYRDPQELN